MLVSFLILPRVGGVKLQALGKEGLDRGSGGECLAQEQLQRKQRARGHGAVYPTDDSFPLLGVKKGTEINLPGESWKRHSKV